MTNAESELRIGARQALGGIIVICTMTTVLAGRDVDIFAKDSYGRGVGTPMACPPAMERIGALCYGSCGVTRQTRFCNALQETCKDVPTEQPGHPFCLLSTNLIVLKKFIRISAAKQFRV